MDWLIPSYYFIPLYQNIIRGCTPVRGASKSEPGGRGGKVGVPSRRDGVRKKAIHKRLPLLLPCAL